MDPVAFLQDQWRRVTPWQLLLLPISLVFRAASGLRRFFYRSGLLSAGRLPVPVVVVGNITAGGAGKTPLTLWLAQALAARGRYPGIVSRGYGGTAAAPREVTPAGDPRETGDEPLLLAMRSGCPVWVGRDRLAAAQALLAAHLEVDVIVTDDGLQHYRLARDAEVAVVDAATRFGNGLMLPAGPLREPCSRLGSVDAVVLNGPGTLDAPRPVFAMSLHGELCRNVANPDSERAAPRFTGMRVHAIAGIGNPDRFFRHLQALGLEFVAHPFPDHHDFAAADIAFPDADAILMTEKDAVKCRRFADERCWYLPVDAEVDPALADLVLAKLSGRTVC